MTSRENEFANGSDEYLEALRKEVLKLLKKDEKELTDEERLKIDTYNFELRRSRLEKK